MKRGDKGADIGGKVVIAFQELDVPEQHYLSLASIHSLMRNRLPVSP